MIILNTHACVITYFNTRSLVEIIRRAMVIGSSVIVFFMFQIAIVNWEIRSTYNHESHFDAMRQIMS